MGLLVKCNYCDQLKPISKYDNMLCDDCEYEDWVVENMQKDNYKELHNKRYDTNW